MSRTKTTTLPTLYKRDSKGSLREWTITIQHHEDYSEYTVTHGQKDGKMQVEPRKITRGKKLGTKAETTVAEQAESEARAKWRKQKQRRGYSETAEVAEVLTNVKPMLAKVYFDEAHKVDLSSGDWIAQPKFNGYRLLCFIRVVGSRYNFRFVTRNGLVLSETVSHIHEQLSSILQCYNRPQQVQSLVLDGELYRHGWALPEISSRAKKYYDKSRELCYRVYDCFHVNPGLTDLPYIKRHSLLRKLLLDGNGTAIAESVILTGNKRIKQLSELLAYRDKLISQGYEGAMLRNLKSKYLNGAKASGLLKVKKFYDDEFEVIGYKKSVRGEAIFVCKTPAGAVFDVLAPGPRKLKVKMYERAADYVGKKLQVQYAEWTNSEPPKPFHCTATGFPGIDWEDM